MLKKLAGMATVTILLIVAVAVIVPSQALATGGGSRAPVLVFVSDGMRMDLMRHFVNRGVMPTYAEILKTGVQGTKGMIPNVPPNTGPGWTGLATGASPSVNGVTNNTFHDNTYPLSPWGVSAWSPGVNQAQTIMQSAQDAGLTVSVLAWQAFDSGTLTEGSTFVETYPDWLTGRGIIANYDVPLQWTELLSPNYFMSYDQVVLADASGWTNVAASYSPAKETSVTMPSFYGPVLEYYVYIYDSSDDGVTNYDEAWVSPSKDGGESVAWMGEGDWSETVDVSIYGIDAGFYLKVIDLEPDLSEFRMYFTPATRARAFPQDLEDHLVANFPAIRPSDYGPYILGLIDDETFMEQHIYSEELLGKDIFPYIIRTYQPDLVLAGNEATDSILHRFLSRATPGTPVYEPENAARYQDYIRQAYEGADGVLKALWDEMPGANVIVTSDHGFQNTWMAINANYVLETLGLYDQADLAGSQAVAYWAGGTAQIYINLQGRNPDGVVAPEDYEAMRAQIAAAFEALGPEVIERVLMKEETAAIKTTMGSTINMMHPDRTGDVVVFSHPPYQFDAATPGQVTAPTPIYGQHGFVPDGSWDRFGVFAAAGPDVNGTKLPLVTALDIAPTVAYMLGIDAPADSEGVVLNIFRSRVR